MTIEITFTSGPTIEICMGVSVASSPSGPIDALSIVYEDNGATNAKEALDDLYNLQTGLSNGKVDKKDGWDLSKNNYSDDDKNKLGALDNWYGVERDTAYPNTTCARIGNQGMHRTLPVQSLMKRCLVTDDGQVTYLGANDSSFLQDGTTPSDLTGASGQYFVEVPAFYYKGELEGTVQRIKISTLPLLGFNYSPRFYYSVHYATIQRSSGKAASVMNVTADYRGGNNNAAYDAGYNTFLGRAATNITRTNARSACSLRGSNYSMCLPYMDTVIHILYLVEYANTNWQLAVNTSLDVNGFRQGGLGNGVTTANGTEWQNFNGSNPFIPINATLSLGNNSGEINYTVTNFGGTGINRAFTVNSYRGIQCPFGEIWEWLDGFNIYHQTPAEGGLSLLYYCNDIASLKDDSLSGYQLAGNLSRVDGWIKSMIYGENLIFMPNVAGSSGTGSTTYWPDYYYTPTDDATPGYGWRAPIARGAATYGSSAGRACVSAYCGASTAGALVGFRLCRKGS